MSICIYNYYYENVKKTHKKIHCMFTMVLWQQEEEKFNWFFSAFFCLVIDNQHTTVFLLTTHRLLDSRGENFVPSQSRYNVNIRLTNFWTNFTFYIIQWISKHIVQISLNNIILLMSRVRLLQPCKIKLGFHK